jgi:CRISPR-associated protein Cas5d
MSNTVKLHVWGDYACFTRPEFKVERISYDVPTPSAARGILEAIHWKPAVLWVIDKIHVLRPVSWISIRRNEVSEKVPVGNVRKAMNAGNIDALRLISDRNRVQRSAMVLRDVSYVIEAHPVMTRAASDGDTVTKHLEIFRRRASKGQCYHRPCLGTREFSADFDLVGASLPETTLDQKDQDFGWMLLDLDYTVPGNISPKFFRARMNDGIIQVPPPWSMEAMS